MTAKLKAHKAVEAERMGNVPFILCTDSFSGMFTGHFPFEASLLGLHLCQRCGCDGVVPLQDHTPEILPPERLLCKV